MRAQRNDEVEALVSRAHFIRESLRKSQSIHDHMISILSSFNQRLTSLEATQDAEKKERRSTIGFLSEDDLDDVQDRSKKPKQGRRDTIDSLFSDDDLDDIEEFEEEEEGEEGEEDETNFLVRTHAIRKAHDNITTSLKATETILIQFDVSRQVEHKIIDGPTDDLSSYLGAVDQLKINVDFFNFHRSFKSSDAALNHAQNLLQKAMLRLEEKFKQTLTHNCNDVDLSPYLAAIPNVLKIMNPSSTQPVTNKIAHTTDISTVTLPEIIAAKAVPELTEMARRMITVTYADQCLKVYREVRSSALEQLLRKLGVEKISKEDMNKVQWEILEPKMGSWVQFFKISVKFLFAAERKLCDQIFYHLDPHREQCFIQVAETSFMSLLSSGDVISKSKRSPEKLFVLLDMYKALRDLLPEIKMIFSGETATEIRATAAALHDKLAQASKETFDEFMEAVEKDFTKTPVQDGTVHPLASYVINYVKFIFDDQKTLKELFKEEREVTNDDDDKMNSRIGQSIQKIMSVLQTNLDAKAKHYKDPALMHIFLMNNTHYIVRSVQKSGDAKDMLGEDWIGRQRRLVQQHATAYQRTAWGKVFQGLSGQGLASSSSGTLNVDGSNNTVSRSALKERFKSFNTQFEELHVRQSQWTIPEKELRDAVRLSVAEILLPAYRNFLKRYSGVLETSKNPQKYIKYTTEDLERMLDEFFEGKCKTT